MFSMRQKVTKGFCIKLTPEEHNLLERASERAGRSMAQIVRELIHAYVEPSLRSASLWAVPASVEQAELPMGAPGNEGGN
jgi:hypothetical protein